VTNRLELTGIEWRRVSPKYVWVDLVRALLVTIVFAAIAVLFSVILHVLWLAIVAAVLGVGALVNVFLVPRRVRAMGYQLREDDLLFRRGLMWQRFVAVPYGRMQLVDINRGPLARALGLSELKFVTAAAAAGVTIPGLPADDADELRDRLVALAESRRAGL
jgi:membrane protein YdbS with pleckstrin-like domain